jgi:hypothetical protein
MDSKGINVGAAVAAFIALMAVGYAWYSPMAFGDEWMALAGVSKEQAAANMGRALVWGSLVALVQAFALAWILGRAGATDWKIGLCIALVVAVGLQVANMANAVVYGGQPIALFLIGAGYIVVGYAVMGAIIGGWPRKAA